MSQFYNDTGHWKLRAEEARLLAKKLDDPEAKAAILKIASEYDNLALRGAVAKTGKAIELNAP